MFRSLWLSPPLVTVLAACCFCTPALAADTGCQPVFEASARLYTMPAHLYTTMLGATSEQIYANSAIFTNVGGKWHRSKMTLQEMQKQEQENIRNSKTTCRYLRDEMVSGEMAALYAEQGETQGMKFDGQVWISKGKGVLLRTQEDMDAGEGAKNHIAVRYEYSNVKPPAGVQ